MSSTKALQTVLGIGIAGLAFSGFLSYQEFFGTCAAGCPVLNPSSTVFGYPACVYGFFMYAAIVLIAGLGLQKK